MPIERRWLKIKEVGEYLGMHPASVYRACKRKKLPYVKISGVGVRIDKKELDALFEREKILPEGPGKILERSRTFIGKKSK